MATPSELSLEEIRKYLLDNGGTARNHDLVKHFKKFLTDPETRVEARNKFKEYVNSLATIRNEEGEKYLVLKKKYRHAPLSTSTSSSSLTESGLPIPSSPSTPLSPLREPPPYRPPPPAAASPSSGSVDPRDRQDLGGDDGSGKVDEENQSVSSPPIPPRRKSQDKLRIENNNKENVLPEGEKIVDDETAAGGTDEDDRASVASQLDGKSREWLVRAAQGDYQTLAKLAAEEPRLARLRDPSSYTALHWGAKHGNEDIVKLIAGTYKDYIKSVNETTNGGYTPLHIAMQFDHENIFNLLVQVYGANQDVRDYSGKKARQYLASQEAAVSQDTFRKIKARKKHAEKDIGFLRIGSLNVRVKRTTEAFSQFLGVATSNASATNEKIHKSWGSADNIQTEHKVMPPPKYAPIKKRRSRRAQDFNSHQRNNNPHPQGHGQVTDPPQRGLTQQPPPVTNVEVTSPPPQNDSDSDNACGFDSAWRGSALM
ncbi:ankyrin repeat domain-containing protein SOWAHB isoform X2 [Neodiprion virginianus]|uniref:ankyrin repeat domain-containing protein SOWAHB isoform X2 n=1 Tax=Neodiprion virginianus TaxID=2961670 RepID=UPI001EE71EA3|nr:ankyrin repeat domain-containing protein SOWAHB isoform X2 [Neodiprion virginianus]